MYPYAGIIRTGSLGQSLEATLSARSTSSPDIVALIIPQNNASESQEFLCMLVSERRAEGGNQLSQPYERD